MDQHECSFSSDPNISVASPKGSTVSAGKNLVHFSSDMSNNGGDGPSLQIIMQKLQQYLSLAQQHKIPIKSEEISNHSKSTTKIILKVPHRVEKSVKFVDNDRPLPITKLKKEKTTVKVSIPNRFLTRPPSLKKSRVSHPRRIQTPDWEQNISSNPLPKAPIVSSKQTYQTDIEPYWGSFDMIEKHRRIELFESRIIWGLDDKHLHPAHALHAASCGIPFVMTSEENKKSNRYENQTVKTVIPKFWESRVWDKPENMLDELQSDTIIDQIQVAMSPKLPSSNTISPRPKKNPIKRSQSTQMVPVRRGRPPRVPSDSHTIILPTGVYETDSEDLSEWEDFY